MFLDVYSSGKSFSVVLDYVYMYSIKKYLCIYSAAVFFNGWYTAHLKQKSNKIKLSEVRFTHGSGLVMAWKTSHGGY